MTPTVISINVRANLVAFFVIISLNFGFSQSGIQVTRYDGVGTGNYLELSDNSITEILNNGVAPILEYKIGKGPIQVSSISDPTLITGNYRLKLLDENYGTIGTSPVNWMLEDIDTGDQWMSDVTLDSCNIQEITGRGFSLKIAHSEEPGSALSPNNGYIGSSLTYNNSNPQWMGGISDDAFVYGTNFIRTASLEENEMFDPNQTYSGVVSGTWFPYPLVSWKPEPPHFIGHITPAWTNNFSSQVDARNFMESINNVNIVLTPDKLKWSRCIVINSFSDYHLQEGLPNPDSLPYELRSDPSVDKNGLPDNTGTVGMSWFPGYAIDVETGYRLNIFFGENTFYRPGTGGVQSPSEMLGLPTKNGKDMIWNPNEDIYTPIGSTITLAALPLGGQHFIYVTDEAYDQCAQLASEIGGSPFSKITGWSKVKWTTIPVIRNGAALLSMADGLIPNEVEIKLRVNNRYDTLSATNMNNGFPMYEFSLDSTSMVATENLIEGTTQVTLSPNPTNLTDVANLEQLPVDCTITVYDAIGTMKAQQSSFNKSATLDPKGLGIQTPGLYYVVITSTTAQPVVKKWLIL